MHSHATNMLYHHSYMHSAECSGMVVLKVAAMNHCRRLEAAGACLEGMRLIWRGGRLTV